MKQVSRLVIPALFAALFMAGNALAGGDAKAHEMKIMLKTDGAEVLDADVSDLAVGESRSFVTESGKAIDIIRTEGGVELYIDGELQDIGLGGEGLHGEHVVMHQDFEIECESSTEDECDHDFVFINAEGDYEFDHEMISDGDIKIIHKRVEVVCESEDDCEEMVWISADGEELHEAAEGHRVIRIHKDGDESSQD